LIVTGEPSLDRVVAVEGTLAYRSLIRGARHATLERTGHLGSITRPDTFGELVRQFVVGRASGSSPRAVAPNSTEQTHGGAVTEPVPYAS
jgi:hypothetical protein